MFVILLVGLAVLGIAAGIGVRALAFGRIESAQRLRSIEMYGFRSTEAQAAEERSRLDLGRMAEAIGRAMSGRLDKVDLVQMRRDLLGAGFYGVTAEAYLGYRIMATTAITGVLLLVVLSNPTAIAFVGLLIGAVLGWRLPMITIQRRAKARYDEIDRELPELIDLLVVSIEAGVGLAGGLQLLGNRMDGALGLELRFMQQEQSMGLSNDQALSKLLDRCDTPAVRSFVRSLQQGERLGVSIGTILRNLAIEMRTRRRQLAEERAQKAPVKILFPLVFMIFPSMFIVLLGPAVFKVKEIFG